MMIKPISLQPGDTIGVFTPSSPDYLANEELFLNGVKNLERLGFRVRLGDLAARRAGQGYRSASPEDRAREFMNLIHDPEVRGLISTIGGSNSASLIPYLNFRTIASSRKVICGYSDVTSLHLAITRFSRLQTFYGPSLMCWFGDWPDGVPESNEAWLQAVMHHTEGARSISPPLRWSNHARSWKTGEWKTVPREWQENPGWRTLREGQAQGPLLAANLNTLLSAAGTSYWPDLDGVVLLLEEMSAPLSQQERHLRHLDLIGAFDRIAGLIVSKPEFHDAEGAPFSYDDLILEVVGSKRRFPIVAGFDCGHTVPMLTIPQMSPVRLEADAGTAVRFTLLDAAVQGRRPGAQDQTWTAGLASRKRPAYLIRRAEAADCAAICEVHKASVRGLATSDYSPEQIEAWIGGRHPDMYEQAMTDGGEIMFVAENPAEPGRVLGFSSLAVRSDCDDPPCADVRAVYIDPGAARCGVGRALLQALEEEARRLGVGALELSSSTVAAPFYQGHGYLEVERTEHMVSKGVRLQCVKMTKFL